ncbi:MAG: hypothetical protein FWH04_00165 [Oscillospiraceae bacterium]|nr:hypothetical protein [Oscillospiraceae bacterium]
MIFSTENYLNLAVFIAREELDAREDRTLGKEDAKTIAMRELQGAGAFRKDTLKIEAYENQDGWMVFATAEQKEETRSVWFLFEGCNDFLDALPVVSPDEISVSGWPLANGSFAAVFTGPESIIRQYHTYLHEFAIPFEAGEFLSFHLTEQNF